MKKPLNILEPGSDVALAGDDPIPATIISATIGVHGHVVYTVSYWNGRCRMESQVEEWEIMTPPPAATRRIGFGEPGKAPGDKTIKRLLEGTE